MIQQTKFQNFEKKLRKNILREKALGTRFIFASRVNFSIDDADGSEIVTFKVNSPFFKLRYIYFSSPKLSYVGQFP